jgi:hypothetical protein
VANSFSTEGVILRLLFHDKLLETLPMAALLSMTTAVATSGAAISQ